MNPTYQFTWSFTDNFCVQTNVNRRFQGIFQCTKILKVDTNLEVITNMSTTRTQQGNTVLLTYYPREVDTIPLTTILVEYRPQVPPRLAQEIIAQKLMSVILYTLSLNAHEEYHTVSLQIPPNESIPLKTFDFASRQDSQRLSCCLSRKVNIKILKTHTKESPMAQRTADLSLFLCQNRPESLGKIHY